MTTLPASDLRPNDRVFFGECADGTLAPWVTVLEVQHLAHRSTMVTYRNFFGNVRRTRFYANDRVRVAR